MSADVSATALEVAKARPTAENPFPSSVPSAIGVPTFVIIVLFTVGTLRLPLAFTVRSVLIDLALATQAERR